MKILSLGWGVQSFTIAAMAALGDLPRFDVAIHADTTHEMQSTYDFAARWTPWLDAHGIHVITTRANAAFLTRPRLDGLGTPPFFTVSASGKTGKLNRSCTQRWKIANIRRAIRALDTQSVEQWIGISTDEWQRVKMSDVQYIKHYYPLLEYKLSRADCVAWLEQKRLEVPFKSSCYFCPFHDFTTWQKIAHEHHDDFARAIIVDATIRTSRPPRHLFISPARVALSQLDFSTQQERGQLSWDDECNGVCGV